MKKIFTLFATCLIASTYAIAQNSEANPGTLKASTLGGIGKRPVFSDPDGVLINQFPGGPNAPTHELFISVPAADFRSLNDVGPVTFDKGQIAGKPDSNIPLIAPAAYMPYLVKVNTMRVCLKDNISANLQVDLFEVYPDPTQTVITHNTLSTVASSGTDPKFRCFDKEVGKVFDYSKFSYYLQARPIGQQTEPGIWSGKVEDLSLVHVILFYTYL